MEKEIINKTEMSSEEYNEELEITVDMQHSMINMLSSGGNSSDADLLKKFFDEKNEEIEAYPNGKKLSLEELREWVNSDEFPAEEREKFEEHIKNVEKNLKTQPSPEVKSQAKDHSNLESEDTKSTDLKDIADQEMDSAADDAYPASREVDGKNIAAIDEDENDRSASFGIQESMEDDEDQLAVDEEDQSMADKKPGSSELSDDDRKKAEKLKSPASPPKLESEVSLGIPPQVWLIPINAGGMVLACMIPGG
ncbi:MAG: hypothetical protein LBB13_02530, partial [Rickettsiales bacterium]|nr:hypothetical protein [Rickettsiales bacterium]